MTASHHYLESLQEAETSLWVKAGLDQLEEHVRATGGSDELLDLIDYLREDNSQWMDPKFIAEAELVEAKASASDN